ncbi:hypothetical protein MMC31_000841 [Peltigera leucophlebia]|nr:hypothetical protein [Peltigera leucophlebia]
MQDQKVIIIGAGVTGLLLAQGLSKKNIKCTIYEADLRLNSKDGDWGMGIHWSVPMLQKVLPDELFARIQEAQVDPFRPAPESDFLPIINGDTGEELKRVSLSTFHRFSRSRMRKLCAEGLAVEFNKRLVDIQSLPESDQVIAKFSDGTSATGVTLIGADGPRSFVRQFLLGIEKADLKYTPFVSTRTTVRYADREKALAVRKLHPIHAFSSHPNGNFSWINILNVLDPEKPETWTFQLLCTWAKDDGSGLETQASRLNEVKARNSTFADPFGCANAWIPEGTPVSFSRLTYWEPIPWDNHGGRISLAGDAAHPMTFHRGQGANHAIADVSGYIDAIERVRSSESSLQDAVKMYEEEMIPRSGEEVRLSLLNTKMTHSWKDFMQSPVVQKGIARTK